MHLFEYLLPLLNSCHPYDLIIFSSPHTKCYIRHLLLNTLLLPPPPPSPLLLVLPFPALLRDLNQARRRREGKSKVHCIMELKAAFLVTTILAILLSSPALAQKSPPSPIPTFLPPSPAPAPAPHHVNLTDLFDVAGPFHTFLNYLVQTKVIETFQNQANKTHEGITIFVPKDSAFAALKKSTFANLTQDQLKSLLLYHAFPKYYPLASFKNLSSLNPVSTFAGFPYTLNLTDNMGSIHVASMWSTPKITSSVYATAPVAVYEVDKVLLPMQIFSKDPPLAPAPAPAPDAKVSDVAPSPAATGARGAKDKADSTSASYNAGVGLVNYLVLAASGGLMLLW